MSTGDANYQTCQYKPSLQGKEERLPLQNLSKNTLHPSKCQAVQEEIPAPG